ncbi:hypothetical protein N2152v2_008949 [Parachlorella kessleri]
MAATVGVNAEEARKYSDVGTEFKVPKAPRAERLQLSRKQWMEQYGTLQASEEWFEARQPRIMSQDTYRGQEEGRPWYCAVGRDHGKTPLWMQQQWHMPELDCPQGRDRHSQTIDERVAEGNVPLWAERMNLTGNKQGKQSSTIYGHREEYKPAQKTDARSMYERYQVGYDRVLNEELPDTSDPADGRFWKAGVAQGVTTNPYQKRLAISGRRKPVVIGPNSISVIVDGEGRTLGNALRDAAWLHPAVRFAGCSLEHPAYRHVNLRVETWPASGVGGEQALAESLELAQELFRACAQGMGQAGGGVEPAAEGAEDADEQAAAQRLRVQQGDERRRQLTERWLDMQRGAEPYDSAVELELFGRKLPR